MKQRLITSLTCWACAAALTQAAMGGGGGGSCPLTLVWMDDNPV